MRVVVVDDDPDIRLLLHTSLSLAGFEVVGEAANGEEAIRAVEDLRPDGVILDVMMPVMDGLTALPEIKRVAPEIRVVVYSSVDVTSVREEAARHGVDRVVAKTAGPTAVVAALRSGPS